MEKPAWGGMHPSEIQTGLEGPTWNGPNNALTVLQKPIMMDEYVGGVGTLYKATSGNTPGAGHHWKYTSCEFLGPCDETDGNGRPTQMVGSMCSAIRPDLVNDPALPEQAVGFCYLSRIGTLECGRTFSDDDEYHQQYAAEPPQNFKQPKQCSPGSQAGTYPYPEFKRLLIGGCMLPDDPNYSAKAEVHVPSTCSSPAPHKQGCMFPGALDFDPEAKQSGSCQYPTKGCTSKTAFNYNEFATIDEGCIEPVGTCSLNKEPVYTGIDADTPLTKLFVGQPIVNPVGTMNMLYEPGTVLAAEEGANVISGCVAVIEGCMNDDAINFEPKANAQTETWCIMPKTGCMLPPASIALKYSLGDRKHERDQLATTSSFDPTATVHDASMCTWYHLGCKAATAMNYDQYATVNYDGTETFEQCYYEKAGCLNRQALNYGCESAGQTPCDPVETMVTEHVSTRCSFYTTPPPSPPTPPTPKDAAAVNAKKIDTEVKFEVSEGDAATVCDSKQDIAETTAAEALALQNSSASFVIPEESVECQVSGSTARRRLATNYQVVIAYTVKVWGPAQTEEEATAAAAAFVAGINSPAFTSNTVQVGGTSYQITATATSTPEPTTVYIEPPSAPPAPPSPPKSDSGLSVGAIVGIVLGVLAFLVCIAVAVVMMMKKKSKAVTPNY